MAALPITLDPVVLGDAGLSTRTKVSVRADGVTIGSLLDDVLSRHGLAWEERDGELVIVRLRRN
jgi:hypothetical protein